MKHYFKIYELCNDYYNTTLSVEDTSKYEIHRYKLLELWCIKNLLLEIIDTKNKVKFKHILVI